VLPDLRIGGRGTAGRSCYSCHAEWRAVVATARATWRRLRRTASRIPRRRKPPLRQKASPPLIHLSLRRVAGPIVAASAENPRQRCRGGAGSAGGRAWAGRRAKPAARRPRRRPRGRGLGSLRLEALASTRHAFSLPWPSRILQRLSAHRGGLSAARPAPSRSSPATRSGVGPNAGDTTGGRCATGGRRCPRPLRRGHQSCGPCRLEDLGAAKRGGARARCCRRSSAAAAALGGTLAPPPRAESGRPSGAGGPVALSGLGADMRQESAWPPSPPTPPVRPPGALPSAGSNADAGRASAWASRRGSSLRRGAGGFSSCCSASAV
jgi:hypothetical protein